MSNQSELTESIHDQVDDLIQDETESEEDEDRSSLNATYDITSFGIDFDVRGVVGRLQDGDITIRDWQRGFVWSFKMASNFVESLLLGLPVPGIFLGTDPVTKEMYVVDGQQRLRTLRGFYEGKFPAGTGNREFALTGVTDRFNGTTYDGLNDADRRALNNSLIHATIVRQDAPDDDDTSMYQIFKRLNSGGRPVNPHEIRCAIYQGNLISKIKELNQSVQWRLIVGNPSLRLKDQELILRFMALLHKNHKYARPMEEFLNVFTQTNRNPTDAWMQETAEIFEETIGTFAQSMGKEAFRVRGGRAVNAAVFDSMSIGLANRIRKSGAPGGAAIREIHRLLISDKDYLQAVTQGTSDGRSVGNRLRIAVSAFQDA